MRQLRPTHRHHRRRPQLAGAFLLGVIIVLAVIAVAVVIVSIVRTIVDDVAGGDIGRAMAWLAITGGVAAAFVELGRRP